MGGGNSEENCQRTQCEGVACTVGRRVHVKNRYVSLVSACMTPVKKNGSTAKGTDLDEVEDASPGKGIDLDVANIPHNYPHTYKCPILS